MSEDLGRYSKVYRRIWRDEKFRRLSDDGKLLFLRLLTAPEGSSIPGLVPVRAGALAEELGWLPERLREAFREVYAKAMAKADWEAGLVWLPNAVKYGRPESVNVVVGWKKQWSELPECSLKSESYPVLKAYAEGFGHAYAIAFAKAIGMPSRSHTTPEPDPDPDPDLDPGIGQAPTQRTATAGAASSLGEATETQVSHDAFRLSVQKRPKKLKDNLRYVGPDTPVDGLDQVDRCRRRFALEWRAADRYNGTAYPDSPGADRRAIGHVLGYHRRNKIEEEWQSWMLRVFRAYLEIADDRYILNACHPLALLPRNLPRILTAMKEQA